MAERAAPEGLPELRGLDLREWAYRYLTGYEQPQQRQLWREVIQAFPKEGLRVEDREFLRQIVGVSTAAEK